MENDNKMVVMMTQSDLEMMITRVIQRTAPAATPDLRSKDDGLNPRRPSWLLDKREICARLGIGKTQWERYRDELIVAGMFQLGAAGSSWRMNENDLQKYIDQKRK
jgi:hypothetical protein